MKKLSVRKDSYFDSVFLMLLSKKLKESGGVADAVVAMGTPMNLELLTSQGYSSADLAGTTPNDLVMAVDCANESAVKAALDAAALLLHAAQRHAVAVLAMEKSVAHEVVAENEIGRQADVHR